MKSDIDSITQEEVQRLFDYRDGNLYWKKPPCRSIAVGTLAGNKKGVVGIRGKTYGIKRIIYLYHTGENIKRFTYVDNDSSNTRIENLLPHRKHAHNIANGNITQRDVRRLFEYKDGGLYWRDTPNNSSMVKQGDKVSNIHNGYVRVKLANRQYLVHRLIFLYHHGYLPEFLDHADGNSLNNDIDNLRECTSMQNNHNRAPQVNTSSRYKGVTWNKRDQLWQVMLHSDGKTHYLGRFNSEEDAGRAYDVKAKEIHGEFAKLNFPKIID